MPESMKGAPHRQEPAFDLIATAVRDWLHEQPESLCGMGADTCPDWPRAFEVADCVYLALWARGYLTMSSS